MNYLKINFEELRFGAMKSTFDALERAFQKFGVDFYLIGAFARDIWMNHLNHLPARRTTLDIDFSVYINEATQFNELKDYLVTHEQFSIDLDLPYRLYSLDKTIVDLIPFGGLEKDNIVYLDGHSPIELSVFGNIEVLSHAENIPGNIDFKICTLPGLCILKLISGNEKDTRYVKDLGDFYYILENYFDIASETLYEADYDDLIEEDFVPEISAAILLGRQMAPILQESTMLKDKILGHLNKLKEGFSDAEIEQMYQLEKDDSKIKRFKLISCLTSELSG